MWTNYHLNFDTFPKREDGFCGEPNEHFGAEVSMFMGYGLGTALEEIARKERRDEWTRLFYKHHGQKAKKVFVVHTGHYGDEPGDERTRTQRWSFDDLISEIINHLEESVRYGEKHKWASPTEFPDTWGKVTGILSDSFGEWGCLLFFDTVKKWEKHQAEERRKQLEESARSLAAQYNVKVGTWEFIKALRKERRKLERAREDWHNPEAKMERWAAHMYQGTRDAYFEDNDYVGGQHSSWRDTIDGIWEWLDANCPLLMAQYRERRLARKQR
jgi:hypothetical protein